MISYRFSFEAMYIISYRFLCEATGKNIDTKEATDYRFPFIMLYCEAIFKNHTFRKEFSRQVSYKKTPVSSALQKLYPSLTWQIIFSVIF